MSTAIKLMEEGKIPEWILYQAIRLVCIERLWAERKPTIEEERESIFKFRDKLKTLPLALVPEKANEQHYEVPSEFYTYCLGKHKKYSSAYFANKNTSLDKAESDMLELTCSRAELKNGDNILELGCGWGSLTLWMAEKYPNSLITAVSNSNGQREYIENQAKLRGLDNIRVITSDINNFIIDTKFDRIVSVEMFEHLRNYELLFKKISSWLKPNGKLFVHIFCHKKYAYEYETEGTTNWLGKYFFTGGMMPSEDLFLLFPSHLKIEHQWRVNGMHYSLTSKAWKENLIRNKTQALKVLAETYGQENATIWFERWKVFFIACEVLFGYKSGKEWYVSHYLFSTNTNE